MNTINTSDSSSSTILFLYLLTCQTHYYYIMLCLVLRWYSVSLAILFVASYLNILPPPKTDETSWYEMRHWEHHKTRFSGNDPSYDNEQAWNLCPKLQTRTFRIDTLQS